MSGSEANQGQAPDRSGSPVSEYPNQQFYEALASQLISWGAMVDWEARELYQQHFKSPIVRDDYSPSEEFRYPHQRERFNERMQEGHPGFKLDIIEISRGRRIFYNADPSLDRKAKYDAVMAARERQIERWNQASEKRGTPLPKHKITIDDIH